MERLPPRNNGTAAKILSVKRRPLFETTDEAVLSALEPTQTIARLWVVEDPSGEAVQSAATMVMEGN